MNRQKKMELLAPAGSFETFRAVIEAGADAVYLGGPAFGARAYANNFTEEELLEAIDYAHLRGCRVYLTVNTLLKNQEIGKVRAYLEPYVKQGLDAVLVQDFGVLALIREAFPDLDIHTSTQMTVTGVEGVRFLQQYGVSRVVMAREVSLEEMKKIHEETNMELEAFVHGAICYCYSGQCLFSSMLGGRSGNRGRCAQPCRLPYEVRNADDKPIIMKDSLPAAQNGKVPAAEKRKTSGEMRSSGKGYSGKNHPGDSYAGKNHPGDSYAGKNHPGKQHVGRNNPGKGYSGKDNSGNQYVNGSRGYAGKNNSGNNHADSSRELPSYESYVISLKDMCGIEDLRALRDAGVYSLKIEGRMKSADYAAGVVSIYRKYLDQLLELPAETAGTGKKEKPLSVSREDRDHLSELGSRCGFTDRYYYKQNGSDMITFRQPNFEYRNPDYHAQIIENYVKKQQKLPLEGRVTLKKGEPALFEVWNLKGNYACARGEIPLEAQKKPLVEEEVRQRMNRTGDTPYAFSAMEVILEEGCFLPNGSLNQLRRDALDRLTDTFLSAYRRNSGEEHFTEPENGAEKQKGYHTDAGQKTGVSVLAETGEQLEQLLLWQPADRIYADVHIYTGNGMQKPQSDMEKDLERAHNKQKQFFLALPQILRSRGEKELIRFMESPQFKRPDGYLVRNYEEFYLVQKMFPEAVLVTDHNLYTYNDQSVHAFLNAGAGLVTMPLELNAGEIAERENGHTEIIVYGYYPLMVSAQCIHANTGECDTKPQIIRIKDRYHALFPVKNNCRECYNVIYNSVPVCLGSCLERLRKAGIPEIRLQFTIEDAAETRKVLSFFEHTLEGKFSQEEQNSLGNVTYGHYKRGVE